MAMDKVVFNRIKSKIEPGMYIVPHTTPIVYFGNYETAKACTISLNPSVKEFLDSDGKLLMGNDARLCSRVDFNKQDDEELTDQEAKSVKEACDNYFRKNPYWNFFRPFETFLNQFQIDISSKMYGNYSYNDTCVNLNIVQWATTDNWSRTPGNIRRIHLNNDLPILECLLKKKFEVMFLNGRTVVDTLSNSLRINLRKIPTGIRDSSNHELYVSVGEYNNATVIGWNLFYPKGLNINAFFEAIKKAL